MAIKKRIKELQARLTQIESEPTKYWVGKWTKSIQTSILKSRIRDLQKQLKPNHHPKPDSNVKES